MPGVFFLSPQSIKLNSALQVIHNSQAVNSSGSVVLTGVGYQEGTLVVNVSALPVGPSPTLSFTIQEVDPVDQTTVISTLVTSSTFTGTELGVFPFTTSKSDTLLITWNVSGSASFPNVSTSIQFKGSANSTNIKVNNAPVSESNPVPVTGSLSVTSSELVVDEPINYASYNLQTSAFNQTTSITNDYILDRIVLKFSTSAARNISITHTGGEAIFTDVGNTDLALELEEIEEAYDKTRQITVSITQTSSPCLVDVLVVVKKGAVSLSGNPLVNIVELPPNTRDANNEQTVPLTNGPITSFTVDATTDVFTSVAHGLSNLDRLVFTTTGTLPGGVLSTVAYFVRNVTADTFQLSTTETGAIVDVTSSGSSSSYQKRGEYVGTFTRIDNYLSALALYASITPLQSVQLEWSDDGTTSTLSIFSPQNLQITQVSGYYTAVSIQNGVYLGRYYRLRVVNGPNNQSAIPSIISLVFLCKTPYTGTYQSLTANLTLLSQAHLTRSVLAATLPDGTFANLTASHNRALAVNIEGSPANAAGELAVASTQDTIRHIFSASEAVSDITRLLDYSNGGTVAPLPTDGQVLFSTGAAPGQTAIFLSEKTVVYEAGHPLEGSQTFVLESMPTGDGYVEWGFIDNALINGTGWGVDSTGAYIWRKKNTIYKSKVYQSAWNRDKCDGNINSRFRFNNAPQVYTPLKSNLYFVEFEWFGSAPHEYYLKGPDQSLVDAHIEEYPNQHTTSSLPDPNLHLFIAVRNDTSLGGDLRVRSGCWRGCSHTSRNEQVGQDPNDDFGNIRIQGTNKANSTTAPLDALAIYRGTWFPWQKYYSKMVSDLKSDVPGALYIDLSNDPNPINGSDESIDASLGPYYYNPADNPLFRRHAPVQSQWVRHRYVNGNAAQSEFQLYAGFVTSDPGTTLDAATVLPSRTNLAALTRSILTIPADGYSPPNAYQEWPIKYGKPEFHLSNTSVSFPIRPNKTLNTGRVTVTAGAPIQVPSVPLTDRARIKFTNVDTNNVVYLSESSSKLPSQGHALLPRDKEEFTLDAGQQIYMQLASAGTTSSADRDANTTSAVSGVSNPNSLFVSDNVYATFTNIGDTVTLSGFSSTAVNDVLASIKIKLEGNKSASPSTEQAAFVDIVTGTAGNVGLVSTSTNVISNTSHFYLAYIDRRNKSSLVTGVTGLGLTWTQVSSVSSPDDFTILDVWKGTGTPTGNGIVSATLSQTATNAVIAVARFSGVNLSSPIQNQLTQFSGTATGSYSGSITGTNRGLAIVGVAMRERTHTAGSGFTEQVEVNSQIGGGGASTASLAVNTLPLSATGSQAYSGTLSGNTEWVLNAITLTPAPSLNPVISVEYNISSGPTGASKLIATLTSSTDTVFTADITGDKVWTFADVANVRLVATLISGSAATSLVDRIYLEITGTTSTTTAEVTYAEIGGVL